MIFNIMLLNPRQEDNLMPTVVHPLLQDGVEARAYQIRALKNALSSSCLMVMPTGFGKTAVEWMVMAEFLIELMVSLKAYGKKHVKVNLLAVLVSMSLRLEPAIPT